MVRKERTVRRMEEWNKEWNVFMGFRMLYESKKYYPTCLYLKGRHDIDPIELKKLLEKYVTITNLFYSKQNQIYFVQVNTWWDREYLLNRFQSMFNIERVYTRGWLPTTAKYLQYFRKKRHEKQKNLDTFLVPKGGYAPLFKRENSHYYLPPSLLKIL